MYITSQITAFRAHCGPALLMSLITCTGNCR